MFEHIELRPYQIDGINKIRSCYRNGARAPLYVLPTGGGKTYTFAAITALMKKRNKKVRILVHRENLLDQCHENLKSLGIHHGIIQSKRTYIKRQIEVASVQTLVHRLDLVEPPDLYIIDEAHHARAKTWATVLEAHKMARILGVTATPCDPFGRGLGVRSGGFFDTMVLGPTPSELTELNHLAPYELFRPPVGADLSGIPLQNGDISTSHASQILNRPSITGCAISHYREIANHQPGIVFCCDIDHAMGVENQFRQAGYRAKCIHSKMPGGPDAAKAAIKTLGTGQIELLISCDMVSEGTDIPDAVVAILLRPTQSLRLCLQQIGRVLRYKPFKVAKILDHVRNTVTHGFPDDDRDWSLDGEVSTKTKQTNVSSEKECPACFRTHRPMATCPRCGYIYKTKQRAIMQLDGQLERCTQKDIEEFRKERAFQKRRQNSQARSLDQLKEIGKARGYSHRWAYKIFQARQEKELSKKMDRARSLGIQLKDRPYNIEEIEWLIERETR